MKVKGLHFRLVICSEDQNLFLIPPTQRGWRHVQKREIISLLLLFIKILYHCFEEHILTRQLDIGDP